MNFWWLTHPDYESDYQYSYISGHLDHPFGMPGVKCDVCKQTWGGSRILPVECPVSIRKHKNLMERWPLPLEQHQALERDVLNELRSSGAQLSSLRPGDDFQPCFLEIPSRPSADFIWCCLGSVTISKRIRQLFESLQIDRVAYCPVTLRKVGKKEARLSAPIPSSGEPEDIIREVPLLKRTDSVGPYFELIIESESAYAPAAMPTTVCSGCGRETLPKTDARLVMLESMWKGAEVFFLASTLYIVVTERVRQALENLKATNIHFNSFEVDKSHA